MRCSTVCRTLCKLQSVQNATARLITGTRRCDHITLVLWELHWLPIRERVKFKLACLVHQSLSGQSPAYLADDCRLVSDSTCRSLRSADVPTCVAVSPQTYSSYGDRTFAAAGPWLWNSLPVQLRNPDISYGRFRRQLKGHLFGNDKHGALWPSICSAIEKRFTYLHVGPTCIQGAAKNAAYPDCTLPETERLNVYIDLTIIQIDCLN